MSNNNQQTMNYDDCRKNVSNGTLKLNDVPDKWKNDYSICLSAVEKDGFQIEYVDFDKLRDLNFEQSQLFKQIIDGLNKKGMDYFKLCRRFICEAALTQNLFALGNVISKLKDYCEIIEICIFAISNNALSSESSSELALTSILLNSDEDALMEAIQVYRKKNLIPSTIEFLNLLENRLKDLGE